MKTLTEVRALIEKGSLNEAIAELHLILKQEPENVEAEMLLGTCCQLNGDRLTFNAVYEDVRAQMELREKSGEQSSAVSLWKRYRMLWLLVFSSACLLGGLANRQIRLNDVEDHLALANTQIEEMRRELHLEKEVRQKNESQRAALKTKLAQTEESLVCAEKKCKESEGVLRLAENRVREAESRLQNANQNLRLAEGRAREAESQLRHDRKISQLAAKKELQDLNAACDFIEKIKSRASWRRLERLRVSDASNVTNICSEVLRDFKVRRALNRELGVAVIKLPSASALFESNDFVLLMRLPTASDDYALRCALTKNLDVLVNRIENKLVAEHGDGEIQMSRLRRLISSFDWELRDATWEVYSNGVESDNCDEWLNTGYADFYEMNVFKSDILKLRELTESITNISRLVIRRSETEVTLAFKFENVVYRGARTKYGVPRDYGDRVPKRIEAADGSLIFEVDEEAIRNEFSRRKRQWDEGQWVEF